MRLEHLPSNRFFQCLVYFSPLTREDFSVPCRPSTRVGFVAFTLPQLTFVVSEQVRPKLTENDGHANHVRWHFVRFKAILWSNPTMRSPYFSRALVQRVAPVQLAICLTIIDAIFHIPIIPPPASIARASKRVFFVSRIDPPHFRKMSRIESQITEQFSRRIRSVLGLFRSPSHHASAGRGLCQPRSCGVLLFAFC
jgi:hypothetical protein